MMLNSDKILGETLDNMLDTQEDLQKQLNNFLVFMQAQSKINHNYAETLSSLLARVAALDEIVREIAELKARVKQLEEENEPEPAAKNCPECNWAPRLGVLASNPQQYKLECKCGKYTTKAHRSEAEVIAAWNLLIDRKG